MDFSSLSQGFQNYIAKPVEDTVQSIQSAIDKGFQNYQAPPIGMGFINNPIADALSQTPQYINQGAQAIDSFMPQNFLGNVGRDVTNIAAGTLALPGTLTNAEQHPDQLVPTVKSIGSGIVNNYLQDLGFNNGQWSLGNVGSNLYNRPVSTLLDILPFAGAAGKLADAGDAGDVTSAMSRQQRLNNLINYPQVLADKGYTSDLIDRISAPKAAQLLDRNIPADEFRNNPDILDNTENAVNKASLIDALSTPNSLNLLKGMPENVISDYQNWVNSRSAAPIEGMDQGKQFSQYDNQGQDAFLQFQKNPAQFPDLKSYFDQKYQQLQAAGVDVNYADRYLPQIWNNEDDIRNVQKSLNPSSAPFTFSKVIDSYETGIKNGLTPRFNTLGQLAQWYEQTSNKLLADKSYFDSLKSQSLIQPATKSPSGWLQLGQGFPINKVDLPDGSQYAGTFAAPPQLARAINNYLSQSDSPFADASSKVKNIALGSGIPGTGINFHGITTLARQTLFANNPVSGFFKGVSYLVNPKLAQDFIDSNLKQASFAVHNGLNLSIEDHNFIDNTISKSLLGNAYGLQEKIFSDPLFKQILPALKLEKFNVIYEDLRKSVGDQEAARQSSTIVNNIFGGQNLDALARAKSTQNLLRSLLFAPDHVESYLKTGGETVKALINPTNPVGKAYRIMARNLLMGYIGMNITNKLVSGHFSFQNEPGHELEIAAGTTNDGQNRYINPWGSAIDFLKVPGDFLSGIVHGNTATIAHTVQNRLNPFVGMAAHQLSNTNFAGQPLYKQGANLGQQLVGRAGDVLNTITPPYVSNTFKGITGNQSPEQSVENGLQLPVRFAGGARTAAQQNQVALMQSGGATGDQIHQALTADFQAKQKPNYTQPGVLDSVFQWLGFPKSDPSVNRKAAINSDPLLSALEDQKSISEQAKTIKEIYSSGMTPDQISTALQSKGIDPTQAKYEMMRSLDTLHRAQLVHGMLQQVGNTHLYMQTVGELARHDILTSGVVSQWVDDGILSQSQATGLDNAIKLSKNQKVGSTGSSMPRMSAIPTPNFSISRPVTIAAPQVKMPVLQKFSVSKTNNSLDGIKAGIPTYNNATNAAPPNPRFQTSIPNLNQIQQKSQTYSRNPFGGNQGMPVGQMFK